MSLYKKVQGEKITNESFINIIKDTFGLNDEYFSDIDDTLLLLAFTPTCNTKISLLSDEEYKKFQEKYQTCNNQILEYFGDRFLYVIIVDYLYEIYGFSINNKTFNDIIQFITSNRTMTHIMEDKQSCIYVRMKKYSIVEDKIFHNFCGDTFEALIGALYIHLTQKHFNAIQILKFWLIKYTTIPQRLYHYVINNNISSNGIYMLLPNEQAFYNNWTKYNTIKNYKFDLSLLSSRTYIVSKNTPLKNIYEILKWPYYPQYDHIKNIYYIYGNPYYMYGGRVILTIANTLDDLENATIKWLLMHSYITYPDDSYTKDYEKIEPSKQIATFVSNKIGLPKENIKPLSPNRKSYYNIKKSNFTKNID